MTVTIESLGFVDDDDDGADGPERAVTRPDLGLSLVVHGMAVSLSGGPAAELAAQSIVEGIESATDSHAGARLTRAVQLAHERLHQRAHNLVSQSELEAFRWAGACATVVALHWRGAALAIAHVGNCRAYGVERGELRALTVDHTLADELGSAPPPAGIDPAMLRNIVTRALGADLAIAPDATARSWSHGSPILLCTPALPRLLTDAEIRAALEPHDDLAAAGQRLLELARARRRASPGPSTRFLTFTLSRRR